MVPLPKSSYLPPSGIFPFDSYEYELSVPLLSRALLVRRGYPGIAAGWMASANYIGKLLTGFFWGYVADRIGRKPVMIITLVSLMVFPVAFGLAESIAWAVTSRYAATFPNSTKTLAPLFNGSTYSSMRAIRLQGGHSTAVSGSNFSNVVVLGIDPSGEGPLNGENAHSASIPLWFGRFLMGMTCPGHVMTKTLTPELAGSSRVVQATGYVSGAIGFAMSIGPAIGALFARPTQHFPNLFSSAGLFARYPYLLPNLFVAPLAAVCIVLTILFIPETKDSATGLGEHNRSKSPDAKHHEGGSYHEMTTGSDDIFSTPVRPKRQGFEGNDGGLSSDGMDRDSLHGLPSPLCCGGFISRAHLRLRASPAHARLCVSPAHAGLPGSPVCEQSKGSHASDRHRTPGPRYKRRTSPLHCELPATPTRARYADVEGEGEGGLAQMPHVALAIAATGLSELIVTSFDELFPLWAISSRRAGGLEWNMVLVGQVFFVSGMAYSSYLFLGYKSVVDRAGLLTAHCAAGFVAAVLSVAMPFIGALQWDDTRLFIALCVVVTLVNSASYMMYNVAVMAATNPVPPRFRGRVAGLTSASMAVGGSLGPSVFGFMFAWSISSPPSSSRTPLVNQYFAFYVAGILRVLMLMLLWNVLSGDTMTEVAGDPPNIVKLSSVELESICEDETIDSSPGALAAGDRQADLV